LTWDLILTDFKDLGVCPSAWTSKLYAAFCRQVATLDLQLLYSEKSQIS
jgi:hypothetical protein